MLIDRYHRVLNYLRVSVTDRCNLHCVYCVSPGRAEKLPHPEVLRYEEILRLVRIGVGLGINKIRITGGEPLVRKDICDFLGALSRIKGLADISLTTNGVFLDQYLDAILAARVRRINISLDTLNREAYHQITGQDVLERVWGNILSAHAAGLNPIKINVVAMNGVNDHELADIAALSLKYPFHIRFIEYMPISGESSAAERFLPHHDLLSRLQPLGRLIPVPSGEHDGPAARFRLEQAQGEIGFIRPVSHHFCQRCNRLRLTAGGFLRACLLSDLQEDLKTPLRNGATDQALRSLILKTVNHKPLQHHMGIHAPATITGGMSCIGG